MEVMNPFETCVEFSYWSIQEGDKCWMSFLEPCRLRLLFMPPQALLEIQRSTGTLMTTCTFDLPIKDSEWNFYTSSTKTIISKISEDQTNKIMLGFNSVEVLNHFLSLMTQAHSTACPIPLKISKIIEEKDTIPSLAMEKEIKSQKNPNLISASSNVASRSLLHSTSDSLEFNDESSTASVNDVSASLDTSLEIAEESSFIFPPSKFSQPPPMSAHSPVLVQKPCTPQLLRDSQFMIMETDQQEPILPTSSLFADSQPIDAVPLASRYDLFADMERAESFRTSQSACDPFGSKFRSNDADSFVQFQSTIKTSIIPSYYSQDPHIDPLHDVWDLLLPNERALFELEE